MSVLIETGRTTSKIRVFGWTWKMEAVTFKYPPTLHRSAFEGGKWKEIGEVDWTAMIDGYVIHHDEVNGRFQVMEMGVDDGWARLVGETGSPLEAMRLARLDYRAVLAREENV